MSTIFLATVLLAAAPTQYKVSGLVVSVDVAHRLVTVSHERIPGYMEAMVMPYQIRDQKALPGLNAGDMIERLTLYMNRVRQASITKEIIEVVSGAAAAE